MMFAHESGPIRRLRMLLICYRQEDDSHQTGSTAGVAAVSDTTLVSAAQQDSVNGREAFDQLVRRHQASVFALVMGLTGNRSEAEEIVQEVFLRAYLALPRFRFQSSFITWLRRIALNHTYGQRRRRQASFVDQEVIETLGGNDPIMSHLPDREDILSVLNQIPHIYRETLVLFYMEELNISEVAELLDIGTSATKMRLKRARDAFAANYIKRTSQ